MKKWLLSSGFLMIIMACQDSNNYAPLYEECGEHFIGYFPLTSESISWVPYEGGQSIDFENGKGETIRMSMETAVIKQSYGSFAQSGYCDKDTSQKQSYRSRNGNIAWNMYDSTGNLRLDFRIEARPYYRDSVMNSEVFHVHRRDLRSENNRYTIWHHTLNQLNSLSHHMNSNTSTRAISFRGKEYPEVVVNDDETIFITKEDGVVAFIDGLGVIWTLK